MQAGQINHVLRAVSNITDHKTFVIVGASAVIARLQGNVSAPMTMTSEVDIYAFEAANVEDLSDMIDANIGQDSRFHSTFGYYADGVSPETAKMPMDWLSRAIRYTPVEAPGVTAILPDVDDIALAKLVAWREKDIDWLETGIESGILSLDVMRQRLVSMPAEYARPDFDIKFQILEARLNRQR
jgi:hypothetical protein